MLHALSRAVADLATSTADVLIGIADGAFAAEQAARRGVIVDRTAVAAVPGRPAGRDAGSVRQLAADRPVAPARTAHSGRVRRSCRARDVLARFGPDGRLGASAGRRRGTIARWRHGAHRSSSPPRSTSNHRSTGWTRWRSAPEASPSGSSATSPAHGLACTCLELQALSENGEETVRRWRHAGVLSTVDVLDRMRWQLEGWLGPAAAATHRRRGRLRLVPIETVPTGAHQQALWGGSGAEDERAHRALARVQTLLGHGSVLTPWSTVGAGRGQRTRLVPWGDDPEPIRATGAAVARPDTGARSRGADRPAAPGSGARRRRAARVWSPTAARCRCRRHSSGSTTAAPPRDHVWAGPWPVDERWWDPASARRVAASSSSTSMAAPIW